MAVFVFLLRWMGGWMDGCVQRRASGVPDVSGWWCSDLLVRFSE